MTLTGIVVVLSRVVSAVVVILVVDGAGLGLK